MKSLRTPWWTWRNFSGKISSNGLSTSWPRSCVAFFYNALCNFIGFRVFLLPWTGSEHDTGARCTSTRIKNRPVQGPGRPAQQLHLLCPREIGRPGCPVDSLGICSIAWKVSTWQYSPTIWVESFEEINFSEVVSLCPINLLWFIEQ